MATIIKRKTGFYWCDIGTVRGRPSGWVVCYYDEVFFCWHIPVYNQVVREIEEKQYFIEINEQQLTKV